MYTARENKIPSKGTEVISKSKGKKLPRLFFSYSTRCLWAKEIFDKCVSGEVEPGAISFLKQMKWENVVESVHKTKNHQAYKAMHYENSYIVDNKQQQMYCKFCYRKFNSAAAMAD